MSRNQPSANHVLFPQRYINDPYSLTHTRRTVSGKVVNQKVDHQYADLPAQHDMQSEQKSKAVNSASASAAKEQEDLTQIREITFDALMRCSRTRFLGSGKFAGMPTFEHHLKYENSAYYSLDQSMPIVLSAVNIAKKKAHIITPRKTIPLQKIMIGQLWPEFMERYGAEGVCKLLAFIANKPITVFRIWNGSNRSLTICSLWISVADWVDLQRLVVAFGHDRIFVGYNNNNNYDNLLKYARNKRGDEKFPKAGVTCEPINRLAVKDYGLELTGSATCFYPPKAHPMPHMHLRPGFQPLVDWDRNYSSAAVSNSLPMRQAFSNNYSPDLFSRKKEWIDNDNALMAPVFPKK